MVVLDYRPQHLLRTRSKIIRWFPNSGSQGGRARKPTQCAAQALCSLAIPSILLSWTFGNRRKREWRAYSPVLRVRSEPRLLDYLFRRAVEEIEKFGRYDTDSITAFQLSFRPRVAPRRFTA